MAPEARFCHRLFKSGTVMKPKACDEGMEGVGAREVLTHLVRDGGRENKNGKN